MKDDYNEQNNDLEYDIISTEEPQQDEDIDKIISGLRLEEERLYNEAVLAQENAIAENPEETARGKTLRRLSEAYDWLQCVVLAVVFMVIIFVFAARTVNVIGTSMVPTLHDEDSVVLSNLFYTPKQGDIIVLRKIEFRETPIVKRVIAIEGQTVEIDFDIGAVYVDGILLDEPYINAPTTARLQFKGPVTVPEGCVFVLGDNRNDSLDSRHEPIGMVDMRYILGRMLFRLFPIKDFGRVQ